MKKLIKLAALAIAGACLSIYSYTIGVADANSNHYDESTDEADQEASTDEIAVDTQ